MRRALVLVPLAALAAALAPGAFAAGPAEVTAVDLLGGPARALWSSHEGARFTLAGVHWRGPGRVAFRTRSPDGRWSGWRPAAPEDEDRPDPGSAESRPRASWTIGNPYWTGPSDRIEVRTSGRVSRVRAYLVWSPEARIPYRSPAAALTPSATQAPAITPRASWGANESIRRNPPSYASRLQFAIVHHTAGRTSYTRAEAPAIVRGIQLYHVQGNGWSDIGYNFLVDRFGTIYEGRFGGVDRNVVGAHALGFNTGSVGVAVIGTYGSAAPPQAAQDAVARLLAWRLDLAHLDPTAMVSIVSGGSERHTKGVPVPLRTVSGHRDTGSTACPGDALYARLGTIAASARGIGLPKIFDPRVAENDAGFRFTARLSGTLAWSVVVTDPAGAEVARAAGRGSSVDWTWDPSGAPAGTHAWSLTAGAARPATGSIRTTGGTAALAIQELSASPVAIRPSGDGQADSAVLAYRLTTAANVSVEVADTEGAVALTVVDRIWKRAGVHSAVVDGAPLPDGRYELVVIARRADGSEARASTPLLVSRTLGTVTMTPSAFSPNGDGRKDRVVVGFTLTSPSHVRVRVTRAGRGVASLLSAELPAGTRRIVWDGRRASGPIRDGTYGVVVDVLDAVGRVAHSEPVLVDTAAPRVRILPGRRPRLEINEAAALTIRVNGVRQRREVAKARVLRIAWADPVTRLRVVAVDAAGNVAPPVEWTAARGRASRSGQ